MNSEKQRQAINEQELYEDISYVQEVRKNDLKELRETKRKRFTALRVLLLITAIATFIASFVALQLTFAIIQDDSKYVAIGFVVGAALFLLIAIRIMISRPVRDLKAVREDLCPEFVPEKNLVLSGEEELAKSDAPIIRKIVDDPSKRKIKIDNRKVARYVSPDLTFAKMKNALQASLSSLGYELSETQLIATLARLGHGRVIFLKGMKEGEARAYSNALAKAFAWDNEFVVSPEGAFDDLRKTMQLFPQEKSSIVLSLFGLGASQCESFFAGYAEAFADCSSVHSINEDFKLSHNLVVLVYLPEGDEMQGIPSCLLRYGTLFSPRLVESKEPGGEFEAVKTSADEIRYLASKTVHDFYFEDSFASSFDCFAKFEKSKGTTIPNDSENALERMEAVELSFKVSQEDVVEDVLLSNLLPYYLSKYPLSDLEADDSLLSDLKKEFATGGIEAKIEAYLASFKASVTSNKEEGQA